MHLANNIPSLSELSYWRASRKRQGSETEIPGPATRTSGGRKIRKHETEPDIATPRRRPLQNNWKPNSITQSRQPFSVPWALMIEHQTYAAQQLTKTTRITNGSSHIQPFHIMDMRLSNLPFVFGFASEHRKMSKRPTWARIMTTTRHQNLGQISQKANTCEKDHRTPPFPDALQQITPESTVGTTRIFSNQTSPLQNIQSCRSCVAQMESSSCLQTAIAHAFALSWTPLSSKQHRTIGTATTNQPFDIIKNDVS